MLLVFMLFSWPKNLRRFTIIAPIAALPPKTARGKSGQLSEPVFGFGTVLPAEPLPAFPLGVVVPPAGDVNCAIA